MSESRRIDGHSESAPDHPPAGSEDSAERRDQPSAAKAKLKRMAMLLVLALVALVPPGFVIAQVLHPQAASLVVWSFVVVAFPFMLGGWRLAAATSLFLVLLAPPAIISGGVPIAGAALMAIACILAGIGAGWGYSGGTAMVPLAMAYLMVSPNQISDAPVVRDSPDYLVTVMLVLAVSCAWIIAAMAVLMRHAHLPKPVGNDRSDTLEYMAVMAVLVSVSTYFVLAYGTGTNAVWLILTLLVVIQVDPGSTVHKTTERVVGTVAGALIAATLGTLITSTQFLDVLAILFLVAAFYFIGDREHYWVYSMYLTMVIILSSSESGVTKVGEERAGFTVLGAVVAIGGLALARLIHKSVSATHLVLSHGQVAVVREGEPGPSEGASGGASDGSSEGALEGRGAGRTDNAPT